MVSSSEWDAMLSDVNGAFGQTVTVRRRTAGALNTTTGVRPVTVSDTSVTAHRLVVEQDRMGSVAGSDSERVSYCVRAVDLSFEPKPGDAVVDGSSERRVAKVTEKVAGREWVLECEGERAA